MEDIIVRLQDKDDKKAYELTKSMLVESADSNKYYPYFADFISFLSNRSSFIRTRGFMLACAQAPWDEEGKLAGSISELLKLLKDDKPTVIRQCLLALVPVVQYQPQLGRIIAQAVREIDLTKYKDSMTPLIRHDQEKLLALIATKLVEPQE